MSEAVRFRDCECPGTPHDGRDGRDDGDIAFLRPHLDFMGGARAYRAIASVDGDVGRLLEAVGPVYIRDGVIGWNLIDESGPRPLDHDELIGLPFTQAYELVDRADDLYGTEALTPLARRIEKLSLPGATASSTSAISTSSPPRRQRRAPSSRNGSAVSVP